MKQIALLVLSAGMLWSQEARTFVFAGGPGPRPPGPEPLQSALVKGAPYSADVVTENTQLLADGNRIVNRQTGFVARDSLGRTRNETSIPFLGPAGAADKPMKVTMIHDPVTQVTYTLESGAKTAHKVSTWTQAEADGMKRAAEKQHTEMITRADVGVMIKGAGAPGFKSLKGANVKSESLGTQMIEGVMAEGTRNTETIAAGEIGNEKDILIVNEVWIAQDLKAVVLSKRTDPRTGEMTYRLTNIQRAEPAASLFEVPQEYSVVDGPDSKAVIRYKIQE